MCSDIKSSRLGMEGSSTNTHLENVDKFFLNFNSSIWNIRGGLQISLATPSVSHHPAALASLLNLLEMQSQALKQNQHVKQISRWFVCTTIFYCCCAHCHQFKDWKQNVFFVPHFCRSEGTLGSHWVEEEGRGGISLRAVLGRICCLVFSGF